MQFNFDLEGRNHFTYKEYREMIDKLLKEGKTTGTNHSEAMLNYSNMNVTRMNRWDKRATPSDDIVELVKSLPPQKWLVISEAWCGDAAQNLPWIEKMASLNENIDLKVILRDENLDIMDAHLTNGGRAIPKLVAIGESDEILFEWGPRPKSIQATFTENKNNGVDKSELSTMVHTWYAKDKGKALEADFRELIS
ncbi:MAG: thioredoxin family protein [Bacteroidia bacterium]